MQWHGHFPSFVRRGVEKHGLPQDVYTVYFLGSAGRGLLGGGPGQGGYFEPVGMVLVELSTRTTEGGLDVVVEESGN